MFNLFKFEALRLKNNRILVLLPILLVIVGFSGISLTQIYDSHAPSNLTMFNIYNAYAQFVFLFVSFVYIYSFSEDFAKGSYAFYRQIGYSLRKCLFVKFILLYLPTGIIVSAFLGLAGLKYQVHDFSKVGISILSINLGLLFCIAFSLFLSIIFKKTMFAAATNFVIYIACNILNLVALGLTNPLDGNSLSTSVIKYLFLGSVSNHSIVKVHWNLENLGSVLATIPTLVYLLIFGIVIYLY